MAWNDFKQYTPRTGAGSFYPRSYVNYQPQMRQKKHSGSRLTMMDTKTPIISGWKASKSNGLTALYARPYKGSKVSESKTGKTWINLFVTLTNKRTNQVTKTSGMFCFETKKLYIKDFNLMANPKAPNGGYFGTHIRSNYNNR